MRSLRPRAEDRHRGSGAGRAPRGRMNGRERSRSVLVGLVLTSLVACSGSSSGGSGGGSGGDATGGSSGSGGSNMGGSGGTHDGGPNDAGHDTSSGSCWQQSDCHSGASCTAPGSTVCGGACVSVTHPCASDTDCASDGAVPLICDVELCVCGPTNMGCFAGCSTAGDCGPGQSCGSNHHCGSIACGGAGQTCPADFSCGSGGTCARKPCTSDSQCSNACVEGSCYGSPGHCQLAVP
jgi:hypothetical protein